MDGNTYRIYITSTGRSTIKMISIVRRDCGCSLFEANKAVKSGGEIPVEVSLSDEGINRFAKELKEAGAEFYTEPVIPHWEPPAHA